MSNENIKSFNHITRHVDGSPTIIDASIKNGCLFENSIMEGYGTVIIDKEFIEELLASINENELPKKFMELLTYINNKVIDYFYGSNTKDVSRKDAYADSYVVDDKGMIIGTKLSSLKGRNVALCSEKSIAAFIILDNLYKKGKLTRKPSMVLSTLATEQTRDEPHAFILIEREQDDYPTRHLLYDIENPTLVENVNGNKNKFIGLYSLTDEQHKDIISGTECVPTSLFELLQSGWTDVGPKRIYGSVKLNKTL